MNGTILLDDPVRGRLIDLLVILDHHGLLPLGGHLMHPLLGELRTLHCQLTSLFSRLARFQGLICNSDHGLTLSHDGRLIELGRHVGVPLEPSLLPHLFVPLVTFIFRLVNLLDPVRILGLAEAALFECVDGVLPSFQTPQCLALTEVSLGPAGAQGDALLGVLEGLVKLLKLAVTRRPVGVQLEVFRRVVDRARVVDRGVTPLPVLEASVSLGLVLLGMILRSPICSIR
mmetsp:Transcript_57359/g.167919  ORF Transcript_57359/g.167919 Transcript_57359/m.167919 type:complete len:230 (+) Transcript_57359:835-1524(+)